MFSKQLFRVAVQALPNAGKRLMSTRIATRRNASFGVAFGAIVFAGASLSYVAYNDPSKEEIEQIRKEIEDAINIEFANRNDGTSMAGTLVRLAWHQSGTYSVVDKTGGSNGAHMRFAPECEWGANAGLKSARDFLEPIKAKHPNISYADLWTLSAVTAIAAMGGPQVPWRPGRTDSKEGTKVPDGRLPAADSGGVAADVNHLRSIFHRQGFSDREIVALAGAHCIGRCHREASGYWGPWTHAETTFSNEYFRLLLEERWTPKKTHLGKPWTGPEQYENPDGTLMMLPADLALVRSDEFRPYVALYAKDEAAFFKDFSSAFAKMLENGVQFSGDAKKDDTPATKGSKKGLLGLGIFGL